MWQHFITFSFGGNIVASTICQH